MQIKTGILCIPVYAEDSVQAVRRLLSLTAMQVIVLQEHRVAMQRNMIEDVLRRWCDEEELDLVITIGGTLPAPGPSGREIVPEATMAVSERMVPGLPEAMRAAAQEQTDLALIDRSVAVIRGRTLILNLPAGARSAALFLGSVVDVLPALMAHLQEGESVVSMEEELGEAGGTDVVPAMDDLPPPARKSLDPGEFEEFLRRQAGGG
jgi:molybdopterin adenylyltransferase